MRGIINLDTLNNTLRDQDEQFRRNSNRTINQPGMSEEEKQTYILAEGLAIIHERLGNLITLTLSSGGS